MSKKTDKQTDHIDVAYVAHLARLRLSDEEIVTFQQQLEDVVDYVQKIGELDLGSIEPTSHAHPVQNVFRKDEIRPGIAHDVVINNAPTHRDGEFLVPKIVE